MELSPNHKDGDAFMLRILNFEIHTVWVFFQPENVRVSMLGYTEILALNHSRLLVPNPSTSATQSKHPHPLACFPFRCPVDDFRVVGPARPVLAKVGEDALLTCQLLPRRTAAHMEVRWYRSDPDMPVIVHRDGAEVAGLQMEEYRGRAEWTEDGTHEGSVALKIHRIQPGDDGQYWCRFQDGDSWKEASVLLRVVGEYARGPGAQRG